MKKAFLSWLSKTIGFKLVHPRAKQYASLCSCALLAIMCAMWPWSSAYAQNDPTLTSSVVPPSPTAAALGAYGDIPVSLYTGTPTIEIPLHTLKGINLSLPISLSYHAGGVRVNEVAGAAGLGWSLNAGGVITRVMRGLPDDVRDGYLHTQSFLDDAWTSLGQCCDPIPAVGEFYLHGVVGRALSSQYGPNPPVNHVYFDPMPDIFMFNFAGYSGKFIMDSNGIHPIPHNDFKIRYNVSGLNNELTGDITNWTIVVPDGTEFVFGALSYPYASEESQSGNYYYKSSWYLKEVKSASGDESIVFEYSNKHTSGDLIAQLEANLNIVKQWNRGGVYPVEYSDTPNDTWGEGVVNGNMEEVYLSKITALNEEVTFDISDRHDMSGFKRYSTMWLKNRSNNRIRKIVLSHSYFNEGMSVPGVDTTTSARLMERLRLDSVQVFGENDQVSEPPYRFEYFGTSPGSPGLPQATSTARDHWGFYNGHGEVTGTLVPNFVWETPHHPNGRIVYSSGANREPDASGIYMRAGTLSRIVYPTGGWSSFEYEPHTYSKIAETLLADRPATVVDEATEQTVTAHEGPGQDTPTATMTISSLPSSPAITVRLDYWFSVEDQTMWEDLPRVELWRVSDGVKVWSADPMDGGIQMDPNTFRVVGDQEVSGTDYVVLSTSGSQNYQLKAFEEGVPGCASNYFCEASATARWHNKTLQDAPHTEVAGGLRIKRIVNSDGADAANDVVTEYTYLADEDDLLPGPSEDADHSSGVLVRSPRYLVKANPQWLQEAIRAYASDINQTGMGSHIGYRQVTVRQQGMGKTVHFFLAADGRYSDPLSIQVIARDGDLYEDPPISMMGRYYETSRDWKRGLPTLTVQFDDLGNKLSEVRHSYLFSDTPYSQLPSHKIRALNYQSEGLYDSITGLTKFHVTYYDKIEVVSGIALPLSVKTSLYELE